MGEFQLTFIVPKYKVKVYIYITERERKAPTKVVFALNRLQYLTFGLTSMAL